MSGPYDEQPLPGGDMAARVESLRAARLQNVWAKLLDVPDGKLLAWDILDKAGLLRMSYSGNAHTNFLEGERNVANWLLRERIEPNGASHLSEMMKVNEAFMDSLREEVQAAMDAADEQENDQDG